MKTMTRIAIGFLAAVAMAVVSVPAGASARPVGVTARCETAWPAPRDVAHLAEAAMLPTFASEPTGYRADAQLSIVVGGVRRTVPAGIGIDGDRGVISAAHTRTCDGAIRVTAPEEIHPYLGQFFAEWDVRLTQHCIGETCDAQGVRIVLDGKKIEMCPGAISIEDGTRIELSVL